MLETAALITAAVGSIVKGVGELADTGTKVAGVVTSISDKLGADRKTIGQQMNASVDGITESYDQILRLVSTFVAARNPTEIAAVEARTRILDDKEFKSSALTIRGYCADFRNQWHGPIREKIIASDLMFAQDCDNFFNWDAEFVKSLEEMYRGIIEVCKKERELVDAGQVKMAEQIHSQVERDLRDKRRSLADALIALKEARRRFKQT